jgi:hypothetical protein
LGLEELWVAPHLDRATLLRMQVVLVARQAREQLVSVGSARVSQPQQFVFIAMQSTPIRRSDCGFHQ